MIFLKFFRGKVWKNRLEVVMVVVVAEVVDKELNKVVEEVDNK